MLRHARLSVVVPLLLVAFVAACSDRPAPTAPLSRFVSGANATASSCTNMTELTKLVNDVFGVGSPDANSALSKLRSADRAIQKGDTTAAQSAARNLIRFVYDKASSLPGEEYVAALIAAVECYVGITDDSFLVYPDDQPQVLIADAGTAGISLPANPVSEPTLITLTVLPDSTSGLLDTKLDQYPVFVQITQTSGVPNSLITPVVVAVCAPTNIPLAVQQRLRLGHQAAAGFEVTPDADASFLPCAPVSPASASSAMPGWITSVASLVVPKLLHAQGEEAFGGGVGGTVTEFSPFGPVDPMLEFGGGVGGTVTEFTRVAPAPTTTGTTAPSEPKKGPRSRGAMSGARSMMALATSAASIDCSEGMVSTAQLVECRPTVTVATANGTVLSGVPVTFEIELGGGQVAIDLASGQCGSFGESASTVTNANGKARACWTLGATEGTNTLLATVTAGGDAPEGVDFTPTSNLFTRTAVKGTALLALSGTSQVFTGSPIAVAVTTDPAGLGTVSVTYDGLSVLPFNVGTYAVVATLDNASYEGSVSGTLSITPAAQTTALVVSAPAGAGFAYGDVIQLTADGGNGGGDVTFLTTGSTACTVTSAGSLSITSGEGSCAVIATRAASLNYDAVTSSPFTFAPAKAVATLALSGLTFTYDGAGKSAIVTTDPAGLAGVVVTYDAAAPLPVNAGSYGVVASLTNTNYTAANTSGTLEIAKAAQAPLAITGSQTIAYSGSPVTLGTVGGNGSGPVSFDATGSTACSVTAAGIVTATSGSGTCVITATNAGDDNYLPTTSAAFTISVSQAAATLTLGDLAAVYDGTGKSVTVTTAPIGLPGVSVTYDGVTDLPVDAGSYDVVVTLANPDFVAAPAAGQLVIARAQQAVFTLTAPATATFGTTVQLTVGGGSGNGAVSYASQTPTSCTINETTPGAVDILSGVGTCMVSATKAGSVNFEATMPTSASIALEKAGQAISFDPLAAATYGDAAFSVNATASSGLPVSFSAVAGSQCSVTGSTVTLTGAGSCAVQATQLGSDEFAVAAPVTQSIGIAKRLATATAGSGAITLGSSTSLPCSVSGLLSGDAGAVTCTTAIPSITTGGSYITTPVVSPLNPANYAVTKVNGTLSVTYVQQNCFAEPIKSIAIPPTTSGITKGATVQVRCTLLNANGSVVSNAKGSLRVEDYTTGVPVVSLTDAFRLSSGSYTYKLSTSSSGFVKGNFYRVISTWNDGSTTVGWFYLNK